ncbi:helix-turn-helix domain-containing protein [Enterobacter cloacae]|uniref:helix-turn-helix domain-containing protein n=2 Tax=Enterobacter cloacae TaxID=550 RepID=UPI0034D7266A
MFRQYGSVCCPPALSNNPFSPGAAGLYGEITMAALITEAGEDHAEKEPFLDIGKLAKRLSVSKSTIYRNPAKFHMFKVGGQWRANEESLEKFSRRDNNVIRLAVVGKDVKKCRSTKEVKHTGLISPCQTDRELGALLARRKK